MDLNLASERRPPLEMEILLPQTRKEKNYKNSSSKGFFIMKKLPHQIQIIFKFIGEFHAWDNYTSIGISVIFYPSKQIKLY